MTEQEILKELDKEYPNRTIYSEKNMECGFMIRPFCKKEGVSFEQWLLARGFSLKRTGYVESDMKMREVDFVPSGVDAFEIADYVFQKYPLAGEYRLTEQENSLLYNAAKETIHKVLEKEGQITELEDAVLTLETVQLLKKWSPQEENAGEPRKFWNYIYLQYGFNSEKSEAARKILYQHFQFAIKRTMIRYKRFFAPEDTMRYYTTLMLHALAPRQSIEGFFNILFDFYVKNLDFQYVAEDISYKVFVQGMRARWDSKEPKEERLQLKSDSIFSGLQTLFRTKPGYMAVLSDGIVKKMDLLLRGEDEEFLSKSENEWDALLLEWYHKKSATERIQVQNNRQQRKMEYIATTEERIYVQYGISHEKIGIFIPRIRLPRVYEGKRPTVRIEQENQCILEKELSVTGNDLCLTIKSCFITLADTQYDYFGRIALRVQIQYADQMLYDSQQKLYRDYLCLDINGNEKIVRRGTMYLFVGGERGVVFSDDDGVCLVPDHGQLYRVNLDEVASISVDGKEIFANTETTTQFRHHTSIHRVRGIRILQQGLLADIFPSAFQMTFMLPEGKKLIRYQLSIDGKREKTEKYKSGESEIKIPSIQDGMLHNIKIIDLESDLVKYEYAYAVLPNAKLIFNRPVYCLEEIELEISYANEKISMVLPPIQRIEDANIPVQGSTWQFWVKVPVADCRFMGRSAFDAPALLWYESIPQGEYIQAALPEGWTAKMMLGSREIQTADGKQFEIGNLLRTWTKEERSELDLILCSQSGTTVCKKITEIAFKPTFLYAPIEVADGLVNWRAENNFIGRENSQFTLICEDAQCEMTTADSLLNSEENLEKGEYVYHVFLNKQSVFSKKQEEIYSGKFVIGNPNEWRYQGKELALTDALCWDFGKECLKNRVMRPGAGILMNLAYQGMNIASGEEIAVPCYTATLYFVDRDGSRIAFNSRESSKYELINPVTVYVINEHLMIVHSVTEDSLYVDNYFDTIVNRSPSTYLGKAEQKERLEIPDYFEYEMREEQWNV